MRGVPLIIIINLDLSWLSTRRKTPENDDAMIMTGVEEMKKKTADITETTDMAAAVVAEEEETK